VVLIGLDGAPPDLIFRWAREGLLTNIRGLMAKGAYGQLRSTIPPTTCPAWTSSVTGVSLEKHGVYDFFLRADLIRKRIFFANSRVRRVKALWNMLDEVGRTTVCLNMPVTYPPEKLNGAMVTGLLTPSVRSDFTYPAGLKEELLDMGYKIDLGSTSLDKVLLFKRNPIEFLRKAIELVRLRLKAARYLMANFDWDLFIVVFTALDRINHLFWKYIDPRHKAFDERMSVALLPYIKRCYVEVDKAIGELLRLTGPEVDVILYSDHGFRPLNYFMFINNALRAHGLLNVRSSRLAKAVPTHDVYVRLFKRLSVIKAIPDVLPSTLVRRLGHLLRPSSEVLGLFDIEPENTLAFQLGQFVHLNEHIDGDELNKVLKIVLGALKNYASSARVNGIVKWLPVAGCGTRPLVALLFSGDVSSRHLLPADGRIFQAYSETDIPTLMWCGDHALHGTLIMAGPHVTRRGWLDGARIIDIAPTVLKLLGMDIPSYMDGKPLT